jgi:hypothetical protein
MRLGLVKDLPKGKTSRCLIFPVWIKGNKQQRTQISLEKYSKKNLTKS